MLLFAVPASAGPKSDVLIYYANESDPSGANAANWDRLIGWLRGGGPRPEVAVQQLERDRQAFREHVEKDLGLLQPALQSGKIRGWDGAVWFETRLARIGTFSVQHAGQLPRAAQLALAPPSGDYAVDDQPLTRAENFSRSLEAAAHEFDPAAHTFVLVVESHGNEDLALTPRLILHTEEWTQERVLAVARGQVHQERPLIGTSKREFYGVLNDVHQRLGMNFEVVALGTCESDPGLRVPVLPAGVGTLLMSPHGLPYEALDWQAVLSNPRERRLPELIAAHVPEEMLVSWRSPALGLAARILGRAWWWYVPLIACCVWLLVQRRSRLKN